ncbi:tail assembly protein [Pandoraea apista]|uniref:Tail assembly protein n=1 Tax=Pandoraea apista TaxID=93218 RepID=A0ABX9ZLH5_9BURK|nr:tail assembly protein [Pandoraea apista]RSK77847.1 tail assembly protein [Pandoraea apista]RUN81835.1 tail assembly protein [Pandoraea apista]
MSEKLRDIRLYGALGAKFGRVHRLAVNSAAEAIHALGIVLPGFKMELMGSKQRGVAYATFVGKRNIFQADEFQHPPGGDDIRIAPVVMGSKRGGLFQTLVGAALLAAAIWNPLGLTATSLVTTKTLGLMGAALFFGGVTQMLSPQQQGLSTKDSPDNGANYNFNGPVNTQAQGNPVPVLYGRMIVGGAVVSAGIYAEDQA